MRYTRLRPGAAEEYLRLVVPMFDEYARERFLPVLEDDNADPETLIAALNFARTRGVDMSEPRLRELFTAPWDGPFCRGLREACLDAMVTLSADERLTARFLCRTAMITRDDLIEQLCEKGLERLKGSAADVVLDELVYADDGIQRRKFALLLYRISKVRMPESLTFWGRADQADVKRAADMWRAEMKSRGVIPAGRVSSAN